MPDISDAELRQFVAYQNLGTPDEIKRKVADLEKDNQEYRQIKIPALEAKVPKENEVVVPKAKADLIPKYEPLGKPEDIKAKLEAGEKAANDLKIVSRTAVAKEFAKAVGLAEEAVPTLMAIPELAEATFEVKKGKVKDGRGVEVEGMIGYITLPGENQKPLKFEEAQEQVAALKGLRPATPETKRTAVTFVQQGNEGAQPGTVYDRIRATAAAKTQVTKDTPAAKPITERLGLGQTK